MQRRVPCLFCAVTGCLPLGDGADASPLSDIYRGFYWDTPDASHTKEQ